MARRSSTPFALREAHGKWSLVAELNQLEDAGDLLASIGQAAPDLPIERYDPKAAIWREVGRVPLRTKTESLFPHQRKPRKRKPSLLPAVAAVTIVASLVFAALLFAPRINAPVNRAGFAGGPNS